MIKKGKLDKVYRQFDWKTLEWNENTGDIDQILF